MSRASKQCDVRSSLQQLQWNHERVEWGAQSRPRRFTAPWCWPCGADFDVLLRLPLTLQLCQHFSGLLRILGFGQVLVRL